MKSACHVRRSLLAAAATLLLGLTGCQPKDPPFHGVNLTGAAYGRDFQLRDPDGRLRRLTDFRGQVVLLFFGFTQCPDVCPTALTRAAAVRQLLGRDAGLLQVLFVTLDPERDTPGVLRSYTTAFDPGFLGLWADAAGTAAVAKDFKVFFHKVPTGSSYTLDHTTLSYLFDPQGRLRVAIKHDMPAADLAADIRLLLIP
ncbi:SCO family protein [Roseateles amylovorans]|uniref:SCO family protein n=1 Tax=Roseateles amylovorans TaxID=2978473 RepID=A0ABY6B126_9BURK|nr:SCO family protein [Roseateles amylovorans]UXH78253.1 SCO family protein [Roseateles amylovorans]